MYALTELTGPEIVKLLEQQGYVWHDSDASAEQLSWFEREVKLSENDPVQTVRFSACDEIVDENTWERERYDQASEKGGVVSKELTLEIAGYQDGDGVSLDELTEGFFNVEILDKYVFESGRTACVALKDSSGNRYFADFTDIGPGRTDIAIDSEELLIHENSTLEEVWKLYTGRELGSQ